MTGSVGVLPFSHGLRGFATPGFPNFSQANRLPGFNLNGDYITLPATINDWLYYHDQNGTQQWNKNPSSIVAGADQWAGFYLNPAGSKVVVVVIDTNTHPDTFHLASIGENGVVTNVGSGAQPAVNFTQAPDFGGSLNCNIMYHGAEDRIMVFCGGEVMKIDDNNGSITDDPAAATTFDTIWSPMYRSPNNYQISSVSSTGIGHAAMFHLFSLGGATSVNHFIPVHEAFGYLSGSPLMPMMWGDRIALAGNTTGWVVGPRFFGRDAFDGWLERCCAYHGLTES